MWLSKVAHSLERIAYQISRLFNGIAVIILMVMIFFVAMDVVRRYAFNSPIEGSYEAVEFMMAFVFIFGIAYAQRRKRHIAVELVVSRFRERIQTIIESVVYFISLGLSCIITWQAFLRARVVWLGGDITLGAIGPLGKVPVAPFYYAVAIACAAFSLVLLADVFTSLAKAGRK